MARSKKNGQQKKNNGANVGYEAELWQMADALRGSMDAAEYKHVVLGLIFLKYIERADYGPPRRSILWGDSADLVVRRAITSMRVCSPN